MEQTQTIFSLDAINSFGEHQMLFQKGNTLRLGVPHTDEVKRRLSESHKGKIPKNIHMLAGWNKGKPHSEETKRKISEKAKGRPCFWKGKHMPEETKKKLSEFRQGRLKISDGEFLHRFWENIIVPDADSCWIWAGYLNGGGYGGFTYRGKWHEAHRMIYEIFNDDIPEGLEILHSCDIRACVNPNHLSVGTRKDNMQDAKRKGRTAYGEKNCQAILTEFQVKDIKQIYFNKEKTIIQLAQLYHVSYECIYQIVTNRRWKHVR